MPLYNKQPFTSRTHSRSQANGHTHSCSQANGHTHSRSQAKGRTHSRSQAKGHTHSRSQAKGRTHSCSQAKGHTHSCSPVVHDTVSVVLGSLPIRYVQLQNVSIEIHSSHSRIFLHLLHIQEREHLFPEVRALMLVKQTQGVAELVHDQVLLEVRCDIFE